MKLQILKAVGHDPKQVHKPGAVVDVPEPHATTWVRAGYAKPADAPVKDAKKGD